MKRLAPWLSALALVLVLVAGTGYLMLGVLQRHPFTATTTVTVDMPDSGGLRTDSTVVYRGVNIGTVDAITSIDGGVAVRLTFQARYRIPAASTMKVEDLSAIGEPVFEFIPNSTTGPYLHHGQHLHGTRVQIPASAPQMLAATSQLIDQLDPATLQSLVNTLTRAVTGLQGATPLIGAATTEITATLTSRQQDLKRTVQNFMTMINDAGWLGPALAGVPGPFTDFGAIVQEVFAKFFDMSAQFDGDKVINTYFPELDELIRLLQHLAPPIGTIAQALRPVSRATAPLLNRLDFAALLDRALQALPGDRLRIDLTVPPPK
ncbi:MlaD family protein [Nocardia vaccinii]|uniref:MlaD family protein n=1 Tax=Nocardia vaccinii TaxID=1822 RepID=UPI0008337760|nr:MlaD family protein [Nocardia vaccinii]